jgi:hypothetical protein
MNGLDYMGGESMMNALILQSDSTLKASTIIIPDTNVRPDATRIIPERFGSTTKPSKVPILPPEFGSVSEIEAPKQSPTKE